MRSSLLYVFMAVFLLSGCASHYEYNSVSKQYDFSVGDDVRIWTEKTGKVEFEVTKVTESAVYGEGIEIPLADIQGASIKELDEWQVRHDLETGFQVTLGVAALLITIALAALGG